jgi:fructokinase
MGEALVDIIIDAEGELTSVVGGGELNTARAIARLGVPVSFLGGISSDPLGVRIRQSIEADGIELALSEGVEAPTTLAIAQIAPDGSATYRFLLENTSMAAVDPETALAAIPANCSFLHLGSIGLAVEPFSQAAVAVVQGSPQTRTIMFDPNFRPAISGVSEAFRSAWQALLPRVDILKASTEDLGFLFPDRAPLESARALHDEHGFVVLMTDGHGDVFVISANGSERCVVPRVEVVDTVGAGDSFSGGFAAWWELNNCAREQLHDIATLLRATNAGVAVAAANCQRAGANPPRRDELASDWLN